MWYCSRTGRHVPTTRLWATLLTCSVIVGCGGGVEDNRDFTPSEALRVSGLVSSISDTCNDPELFEATFVADAAPSDSERSRYSSYLFDAASPDIDGDTATVKVRVERISDDSLVGEVEWEAVKEGGKWKLKKAPLPAGAN